MRAPYLYLKLLVAHQNSEEVLITTNYLLKVETLQQKRKKKVKYY